MKILNLEEIEGIPVLGSLVLKPVRKPLGITAFGINAYTAANAGDEVVETLPRIGSKPESTVVRGIAGGQLHS